MTTGNPNNMRNIRQRVANSRSNLDAGAGGGGVSELEQAITAANQSGDQNMVELLQRALTNAKKNFEGTQSPAPSSMGGGQAPVAADHPPVPPSVTTTMPPPQQPPPATAFSSNNPSQPVRQPQMPSPGPGVPSSSFGSSNAPRNRTGGSSVGLRADMDGVRQARAGDQNLEVQSRDGFRSNHSITGVGVATFGTDDQIANWHGKAEASNTLMSEPRRRPYQGTQDYHPRGGASRETYDASGRRIS